MAGTRSNKTVRGLVQSMAVIGAAAACIYVFVPHAGTSEPVKTVDYRVEQLTAQRAAPYPVQAPVGLPGGWKATSVSYERQNGNAWHLGFLDPEGQYVAVEQSTGPAAEFVTAVSKDASKTSGTQQVGGETWQRWKGAKYDALVRHDKGSTTVVTGTASYEQLAKMAAALKSGQA
ncbi:DUF4245 domain-containing protein [Streptomyces sp. NBC_01387]|uniref:DUF4245 domain-containing protein n=1 Tax=unclassified Streptomyces TaxID=2593676 RepID=UPI00224F9559|nr:MULTISPECIES: DUF4245 domain-containing protein [unclassified Streptomyces]MCX4548503.1 DUF4245 domain-containing protein [Streptomyces sp. NBC_01500]WSC20112.1 DUF4245 domain-containing protein [Streptomyces sp. NBC_01766]WSV54135.1 DUF4245 domain-containing protein [Streptomyces sp. NBC_01014]